MKVITTQLSTEDEVRDLKVDVRTDTAARYLEEARARNSILQIGYEDPPRGGLLQPGDDEDVGTRDRWMLKCGFFILFMERAARGTTDRSR